MVVGTKLILETRLYGSNSTRATRPSRFLLTPISKLALKNGDDLRLSTSPVTYLARPWGRLHDAEQRTLPKLAPTDTLLPYRAAV